VSADGRPDLGILTKNARSAGFNAVFLTDHNQASDFSISNRTANNAFFDASSHDDINHWTKVGSGVTQVSSPVHSGSASTHLSSTGTGEQYLWTVRGPNFRAGTGAVTTTFSVYPVSIGAGSSFYVSASLGGDVTVQKSAPGPEGYTPAQSGIPASCKTVIFIWYFGTAPDPARYTPTSAACSKVSPIPPAIVKAFPITAGQCDKAFTINAWNTCTLDVDAAVATLAAADKPYDYLGLSELKVAALGTVNAYVDDYATKKAVPSGSTVDSRAGDEFAARNALLPQYDDPVGNFRIFPSIEEGTSEHAQRFNFGITTAGQFTTFCNGTCNYANGVSGIGPTEASGYPGQLNHPGVPGGVTDAQATGSCSNGLTPACGGDTMEVRQRNMSNDWDTILKTGTPLVGDWGSDNHVGTWSGSSMATFIYAPSNGFDDLMQALFEGRIYDAKLGTVSTHLSFLLNVGTSAAEPYPARYPLFVPTGTTVNLHATLANIKSGAVDRRRQPRQRPRAPAARVQALVQPGRHAAPAGERQLRRHEDPDPLGRLRVCPRRGRDERYRGRRRDEPGDHAEARRDRVAGRHELPRRARDAGGGPAFVQQGHHQGHHGLVVELGHAIPVADLDRPGQFAGGGPRREPDGADNRDRERHGCRRGRFARGIPGCHGCELVLRRSDDLREGTRRHRLGLDRDRLLRRRQQRRDPAVHAGDADGHERDRDDGDDRLDALVGQRCCHPLRRQPEWRLAGLRGPARIGRPELQRYRPVALVDLFICRDGLRRGRELGGLAAWDRDDPLQRGRRDDDLDRDRGRKG